jgi:hypothetical protein
MTFTWYNETDVSCAVGNTPLNVIKENRCNLTGRLQFTALTTETLKFLEMFIMKIILSLIITSNLITPNQSAPIKTQMR